MDNICTEPMLTNQEASHILHLLDHDINVTKKMEGHISQESIKARVELSERCKELIKNVNRLYGSDYKKGQYGV